jgi:P-type Ca2+ transporter type 2C
MLAGSVWSAVVTIAIFVGTQDRTQTLVTLVLIEFFKAFSFRTLGRPVHHSPFDNRWLNLAVTWELALLVAVVYVPMFQVALGTSALSLAGWALAAASAFTIVPVLEGAKAATRLR